MSNNGDLQNKFNTLMAQQQLLQRQMTAQNKINGLLERSAEAMVCGPDCQKQKIIGELNQKYLNAQTNMQTASINLEHSRKNYYVYKDGQAFYDNMLEEELKQKAEHIGKLLSDNFNVEIKSANTMNQYYNTDINNSKYTKEFLATLSKKNKALKLELRSKKTDILTNDRKTYYENTASDNLSTWYTVWFYLYYILFVIFVISIFVVPNNLTRFKKIGLIILLVFYPYYIDLVVRGIYGFVMNLYNSLPKSVYNNL
jgi:DNA repair ATPase RecN